MEKIHVFTNPEFGEIRTIRSDYETWFVGKDIAKALGYKKTRNAIVRHVDAEDKKEAPVQGPQGGKQKAVLINESGMYALILSSRLESAKRFKRWITGEVLPSIRKYGVYATDETLARMLDNPDFGIEVFKALQKEKEKQKALEREAETQKKQIEALIPKGDYYDQIADCEGCTNIRNTAKELGIHQGELICLLFKEELVYRDFYGRILPYAKPAAEKYLRVKQWKRGAQYGPQTMITPEGMMHFVQVLKKKGEIYEKTK